MSHWVYASVKQLQTTKKTISESLVFVLANENLKITSRPPQIKVYFPLKPRDQLTDGNKTSINNTSTQTLLYIIKDFLFDSCLSVWLIFDLRHNILLTFFTIRAHVVCRFQNRQTDVLRTHNVIEKRHKSGWSLWIF